MLTRKIITFFLIALLPVGQASLYINPTLSNQQTNSLVSTKLVNISLTGLATGQEAEDINTAVDTATNAVVNNYLFHYENKTKKKLQKMIENDDCDFLCKSNAQIQLNKLKNLSDERDEKLKLACRTGDVSQCQSEVLKEERKIIEASYYPNGQPLITMPAVPYASNAEISQKGEEMISIYRDKSKDKLVDSWWISYNERKKNLGNL